MTENESDLPDESDEPQDVEVLEEAPRDLPETGEALAAPSSALSRRDPLGVYMRDVQRYPLLSKEEEHDLAVVVIHAG